jgi:predicted MFS family arabinose efflux permease
VRSLRSLNRDVRRILVAQALRAFVYGFGSITLAVSLQARGWSSFRVGILLLAVVGGTALTSVVVGTYGDRFGRRRSYAALFVGLALTGVAFATTSRLWILFLVALTGTLSPEVIESGPFTSLEQAMLPQGLDDRARNHVFGRYNAVATLAGSLGALAAGGPSLLRRAGIGVPGDQRFFLVFVPAALIGAALALSLSEGVEPDPAARGRRHPPLERSRTTVRRLSALFSLDSFAGGLVVGTFVAYWFRARFGVSTEVLGAVFFAVGILQAASFLVAPRLADRVGLLPTMVFTHLPSNVLLAAIPFAPTARVGIALLLARALLAQMDVPARQAYVIAMVDPRERTAAVAYTNTARYVTRPLGPALAGALQHIALGVPFVLAGAIKSAYDLTLWSWFRRIPVPLRAGPGDDPLKEGPP